MNSYLKLISLCSVYLVVSSTVLAGNIWTNHGPLSKVIKTISISPQDTSMLYAGAFGWGVYQSTDAGNSWINLKNGLSNSYVRSIYALSNSLIFCGTNDGVYKTTDGGLTWSLSLSTPFSVRSLAYDSKKNNLYAATFGSGLYKSTNQGLSWSSISVTDPIVIQTLSHQWSIGLFGQDSLYVGGSLSDVTSGGALFRSLDGGASWIQVQRSLHIGSSVHSIAISPNNPDISLIIGTATKGVYKSTNGGLNWTNINGVGTADSLVDKQINAVAFSTNYRYAGTDSLGGFFSRALNDTTVGWIQGVGLPGSSAVVSSIVINNKNQATVYTGTEGQGVFRSINSGFNWSSRNAGMLGIAARVIKKNSNGQLILGTDFGDGLWFSSDQGNTWNKSITFPNASAVTSLAISNSPTTIYAGTYGSWVCKSTDGGSSWVVTDTTVLNKFVRTLSIHPTNTNLVFAGTEAGVYRTTNGGTNWQAINNGIPATASIRSMAIDSTNPNVLYAGTDSLFMFKTTDGGTSWANITNANGFLPQDMFIRALTIDPKSSTTLYAGSDSGRIYKSINSGTNWTLLPKLPATHSVRTILIDPNAHNVFFAATFGDGIFMSADSGSHWSAMNDSLSDQNCYILESDHANPLTLWAGSGAHGVYQTSFTYSNHVPVLNHIGNKNVVAGNQLRFTISAADSDLTIPSLSVTGLPGGASFTDSLNGNGLFAWMPSIGQIGSYTLTFHASDGVSSDSEAVTINVLDPNNSSAGSIPVVIGWNLLSVPVIESDYRKSSVFPEASSNAFGYLGSYIVKDTLQNGNGYWLKFGSTQDLTFGGGTIASDTITVNAGWNLVGSISRIIPVGSMTPVSPVVATSSVFGYSGISGYTIADSIRPGSGYWIKVNQAGKVTLTSSPSQNPVTQGIVNRKQTLELANVISVLKFHNDQNGIKELFLFSQDPSSEGGEFELPPVPPSGSFDVRFSASQSSVIRVSDKLSQKFPVQVLSPGKTIRLEWDTFRSDGLFGLSLLYPGYPPVQLRGKGQISFPLYDGISRATIRFEKMNSPNAGTPDKIMLYQNYPNPFNPSTVISYNLPFTALVKLTVFDLLGRRVQDLVQGKQDPGIHTAVWSAADMSSGVYYYTIVIASTEDPSLTYTQTKKMFLLR